MSISYLPLGDAQLNGHFRLVRIHPAKEGEIVSSELKSFSVHQAPPYRAISYTWGDPFSTGERNERTELETVLVDGESVNVSKSVANALKAMRDWHPAITDWVWVDAICIDQSNIQERGQQVVLMSQIYSQAESVFIWLGPSTKDSDTAIHLLEDLARDLQLPDSRNAVLARASDPQNQHRWEALSLFMDRRWWTRAWVLQESVLGRQLEFACGKMLAQGDDILGGFGATDHFRDKLYSILSDNHSIALNVHSGNVIDGMRRMRAARLKGTVYSMQACHFRSMSAQATDPRDYVYAKLGLASDGHFVQPDYTKGVQETYRDFVMGHIEATRSLDIIYFDARPRQTPMLPSWVPDWNASYGALHLIEETTTVSISAGVPQLRRKLLEDTPQDSVANFDIQTNNWGRLIVSCCFFDPVDGVGAAGEVGWQGVEATRPMAQSGSSHAIYGDEHATFGALWRTLVANKGFGGRKVAPITGSILATITGSNGNLEPNSGPRFRNYYENVKNFKVASKTVDEWMSWARQYLPSPPFTVTEQVEAEYSFVDVCYFRRLLTTSRGYIGVGPCETEPGDQVCILKGSTLPLILRRVARGGAGDSDHGNYSSSDWSLVGAAYVHGIMDSEIERRDFVTVGIV